MPTQLKPVDVAVVGLGAAGGVAVLPLARAGLKVAGIEAGTWMSPHDFRADEIYNNVRRRVTTVPKVQREIPSVRASASETARQPEQHPFDPVERHDAKLGWCAKASDGAGSEVESALCDQIVQHRFWCPGIKHLCLDGWPKRRLPSWVMPLDR